MSTKFSRIFQALNTEAPAILLESQSAEHPWSQRSFVAGRPQAEIKAYGDAIYISVDGEERSFKGNPWEALQTFRAEQADWMFGYLGYDLKNHVEDLTSANADTIGLPDLYFMVPKVLVEQDRQSLEINYLKGSPPAEKEMAERAEQPDHFSVEALEATTSKEDYLKMIQKSQQSITEGDFYEINLSHQLQGGFSGNPWGLYQKMKEVGPVPFGAFMSTDDWTVCCQSPERFLRKEGKTVFTQPIKGTARRGGTAEEDQKLKEGLINSVKERAENLMIVDLVRNDLSKTAHKGSVEVVDLFKIETYGTVHQMVSTVKAEAEEENPITILKSCFPMGSMTGAPKIRVMKTIERLENYKRGLYSGAIGYITPTGDFDFNVVIRTAIIEENGVFYSAGGAITADADPRKEWEETFIKARALVDVFSKLKDH